MAIAKRDSNRVTTALITSNADGLTPILLYINPTNHGVKISDGIGGSGFSFVNAQRDADRITTLWGTSASDGTPTPIYGDSANNNLLVRST